MTYLGLLTICISLILGACGVSTIFVSGWVKASQLTELKAYAKAEVEGLRLDVNSLWGKLSKVDVLSSKIETVEKGIERIEHLLLSRNNFEKDK